MKLKKISALEDWLSMLKEPAVKKSAAHGRETMKGLEKNIEMLEYVYTYQVQNCAGKAFPCDTLCKWKLSFKEAA